MKNYRIDRANIKIAPSVGSTLVPILYEFIPHLRTTKDYVSIKNHSAILVIPRVHEININNKLELIMRRKA